MKHAIQNAVSNNIHPMFNFPILIIIYNIQIMKSYWYQIGGQELGHTWKTELSDLKNDEKFQFIVVGWDIIGTYDLSDFLMLMLQYVNAID